MKPRILDLFAGPGGWDEGLRLLGVEGVVGIEQDAAACATRAAAGHLTIRADAAVYPAGRFGGWEGLIGSPPCPTFSTAGKGDGMVDMPWLHSFTEAVSRRGWFDPWSHHGWSDPRTPLVLEPLRWVEAVRPRWVALEQVPPVLPLWEQFAAVWREQGFSVWAGVLNAADFGVPQTRRRAFLLASKDRVVVPPVPTHAQGGGSTLFGELASWVSMADALGWTGATVNTRGERQTPGGNEFDAALPSWALTEKARSWTLDRRQRGAPTLDPAEVPSPTLAAAIGKGVWTVRTGANSMKHSRRVPYERPVTEPAPTVDRKAGSAWVFYRPATAVCADPRLSPPGFRGRPDDYDADGTYQGKRSMDDAIKLTVRDALILQSFDPDYPVQGTRTKQFEQVGNAVPPVLAAAALGQILDALGAAA